MGHTTRLEHRKAPTKMSTAQEVGKNAETAKDSKDAKDGKETKNGGAAVATPAQAAILPGPAVAIPLKDIFADHAWNSRQGNWQHESGTPDESDGLKGLADSIALNGQDTPVDVRLNPDPKGPKYKLITGHRRYEAIKLAIANQTEHLKSDPTAKVMPATILTIVRDIKTDQEARSLNLRENVARDNLEPPDLNACICELSKGGMTPVDISASLGINISYVYLHQSIGEKVKQSILNRWRGDLRHKLALKPNMVDLSKLDKTDQDAALAAMIEPPKDDDDEKGNEKLANAKKKAAKMGTLFGLLSQLFDVDMDHVQWQDFVKDSGEFSFGKAEPAKLKSCLKATAKALTAAFVAERGRLAALEAEDAEAEKAADVASGGRK